MSGRLIGVGVGPGDPELMTLKAHRLIGKAEVIAYPVLAGSDSFARSIAANSVKADVEEIAIEIPMTPERGPAQVAYDRGAARIADMLDRGRDVVVLCEGDPLFYGSFMYLMARLSGEYACEIVPGVTSVSASAAAHHLPLVARNEALTVLPGPLDDASLSARINAADAIAIMKIGRHLPRIRALLTQMGLVDHAFYTSHASLPHQVALPLSEAPDDAPYFSMILITKGQDPWLQTR